MWRKLLIGMVALVLAATALTYALGLPGAVHGAWNAYRGAIVAGDWGGAARLASSPVLAFEERARRLALTADEAALAGQPMLELSAALGIRKAVAEGQLRLNDVRAPADALAFHAEWRRAMPNHALVDLDVLLVLPRGSTRATALVAPADAGGGLIALAFSLGFGLTLDFHLEDGVWRVDYMPAIGAAAREHVAIGATPATVDVPRMKTYYGSLLAQGNPQLASALWTPLDRLASR